MTRQWNGYGNQMKEVFRDVLIKHQIYNTALVSELVDAADQFTHTPFSDWIRKLNDSSSYDVQNLDYVRFAYRDGWLVTIEEKRNGSSSSNAQSDTHSILAQMLQIASGSKVKTWRGVRPIFYKGHFVVSFENTTPDDSRWVRINGKKYENPQKAAVVLLKDGNVFDEPRLPLDEQVAADSRRISEWLGD